MQQIKCVIYIVIIHAFAITVFANMINAFGGMYIYTKQVEDNMYFAANY